MPYGTFPEPVKNDKLLETFGIEGRNLSKPVLKNKSTELCATC